MFKSFDIQHDISLADYVSWGSSGPVQRLFAPKNIEELQAFLMALPRSEKILWVGLGSNLLVRQGGFKGTVIFTRSYLKKLHFMFPDTIIADAGAACPTLARFAASQGLTGGEWMAGVPGTVGGALAMNAGAFGGETWNHVLEVQCINRKGELIIRYPHEFLISYRALGGFHEEWFVGAHFRFQPSDKKITLNRIKTLLSHRALTQPTGLPSCGSVFKNPPNDYAARLIQISGLKGYRIGEASISEKHANFIINEGQATPDHIETLIEYVQKTVFEKQGIKLEKEVHIVGDFS